MHYKHVALFIAICYTLGFFAHALVIKKTVYGDGIYYYTYVRSIVIDQDVSFANEYTHFGVSQPSTPTNLLINKHSIGPSLLWLPAFQAAHTIFRSDGYGLPYQLAVGLMNVGYALVGLLLTYLLLTKFANRTVSLCSVIAVAFATNLFFYGSLDTLNSHAVSFFASAVFLTLIFQKHKSWFFIGAALGLISLIRMQDVVYGVLLLPDFIRPLRNGFRLQSDVTKKLAFLTFGFLITLLPQFANWQILYGKFWANPYINAQEGFNFLTPHILGVLFSLQSGLILWTPVILIGLIGLTRLPLMLVVFILELFIVASWSTWWQGASYSGRMFVSVLPLVAIGIANVFTYLKKFRFGYRHLLYIFVLPLSGINLCLILYFLLSH